MEICGSGGKGPAGGGDGISDATEDVLRMVLLLEFDVRAPAVLSDRESSSSFAYVHY